MWVVHWGLLLRLPWRTWVCPSEGQMWRWCSCLGHRGSGRTRYSRELAARAAGNIVLQKGMATSTGQYTTVFLPGEPPSITEKPGRPQSTGLQRVTNYWSDPACIGTKLFLLVVALPQWDWPGGQRKPKIMSTRTTLTLPSESWVWRWLSCLDCRDPGSLKCAGKWTASTAGVMALSESFFEPLVAGNQKASLASFSP